jgi:hypothetical protein
MNIVSDPRIAPAWTVALAAVLLGGGVAMSATRLKTVAYERSNNDISQSRVSSCRVLGNGETVKLGGYYFQPTPQTNGLIGGDLLPEGVYICDLFGNSARIERGGYAQYVISGDPVEMNKVLSSRLQDPVNPDSSKANRPRLDMTRPIYQAQPEPQQTTDKLFQ